jgi:hypothetical protein
MKRIIPFKPPSQRNSPCIQGCVKRLDFTLRHSVRSPRSL